MKKQIRVLLVEDNDQHTSLIRDALLKVNQCKVSAVDSVEKAFDLLSKNRFDIVLSDYTLPDRDGIEFLRELKKKGYRLPFIMATDQDNEEVALSALKEGADDYLPKTPGFFSELPHIVMNTINRFQLEQEKERLNEEIVRKNRELVAANRRLSELAIEDGLTGTFNHRHFQEHLGLEFQRAKRYRMQLSCLMLDLDFFKTINDKYSHQFGDEVLRELAKLLASEIRSVDFLARYGGEEFVILFPEIGYEGACVVAERIRKHVASYVFQKDKNPVKLTVSIGLSSFPEDALINKSLLVDFADKALYKSKASGRNQVSLYRKVVEDVAKKLPELQIDESKVADIRHRIYDITETVKKTHVEATKAMVAALEAKDPFIREHSEKVSGYSMLIAEELRLPEEEILLIEHAALLHDIGKICIEDKLLQKPGKLTKEEYEAIKDHAILGYKILNPIKYLREELSLILYHHEWYNGQGYPHGLKRNEIPLGARIIGVVDAYVTMIETCKVYREPISSEEAVKELIAFASRQFDPFVVDALIKILLRRKEIRPGSYDEAKLKQVLSRTRK